MLSHPSSAFYKHLYERAENNDFGTELLITEFFVCLAVFVRRTKEKQCVLILGIGHTDIKDELVY